MKDLLHNHIRSIGIAARLVIAGFIVGFLYFGKVVLIPFALAVLLAFALHPVVRRLTRWRVPRSFSVMVTVGAFMALLVGISWFIGGQLAAFAAELPQYRSNLEERIREGRAFWNEGILSNLSGTVNGLMDEAGVGSEQSPAASASSGLPSSVGGWLNSLGAVSDPLTTFGLVIILVTLMLLQWSDLRGRLLSFVSGNVSHTTQVLADAGSRIGRFLLLQLVYNTSFGILVGIGLWVLQVPYAPLWGLCAALFRYLPYVGPVLAALLPIFVSLMTSSGWSQPGSVLVMFLVLELVSNNFIEPWLYGSKLGVSEIGIIMMTVVWTYLWGPAGLVLATPLTVCLVVLGTHVPCLSFFARLLGNESELTPAQKLYQRVLAGDETEAGSMARDELKQRGLQRTLNETLLPALSMARRDEAAHWIAPASVAELKTDFQTVCTDLLQADQDGDDAEWTGPHSSVVLWSVCPFTDAAMPIIQRAMGSAAEGCEVVTSDQLIGAALQEYAVSADKALRFCILFLDDHDKAKAQGLAKRLKRTLPGCSVLTSRLGGESEHDEGLPIEGVEHTTSLAHTASWVAAHAGLRMPSTDSIPAEAHALR